MLRTRKLLVLISILLAVLFLVEVPVSAVAPVLNTELTSNELIVEDANDTDEQTESVIVSELEEERTETSKTFRLNDGACMIAQYNMPVHYKDDKGDWVDYDNSLSVIEKEVSVLETQPAVLDEATADSVAVANAIEEPEITFNRRTEKKQMFKNHKSDTGISFSKEAASENMVLVEKDGHNVSWGYKDINAKSAKQKNEKKIRTGNDKFTILDNLTSTVVYESAYDGVDIECITTPVGVKENIILNKKSATNKFVSTYDIGELRAEKLNDREIALYNADDEIEYYINALYMYDANNETSEDIVLNILENANGELVVELVADEQWLNATERVYPVTIDPSFTYKKESDEIDGAFVYSEEPDIVHSLSAGSTYTGSLEVSANDRYSLLKMNELPELNKGDMIVDVTINLRMINFDYHSAAYVGVYEVADSWNQGSVTWNNKPDFGDYLIDYCNVHSVINSGYAWASWNITKLAKEWYNGEDNNGIYFKMLPGSNDQIGSFFSPNYPANDSLRPCFTISYRNNKGLEEHWEYTSVNVRNVGTAYINDYSGALTFELPIASTADPVLPANVSYYYNSYMANERHGEEAPYFADGWRMNMQQTLLKSSEYGLKGDDAEKYPYVYTDADGTEHYFMETTDDDGNTILCDEDNEKLKLNVGDSNGGSKFVITDENLNELHFHHTGLFNKYSDAYGNEQKVNYTSRSINSIKDTTDNVISLKTTNDYITSITDPNNRETSFTYDSNNNLTGISYPDGTTATISYEDGLITKVTYIDGSGVGFGYNGFNQVTSITEYGENGTAGQTMTFDRLTLNETKVYTNGADGVSDTSDDCITTYQYDNCGRTVSAQTSTNDGSELGASSVTYTSDSNIKTINKVTDTHALGANAVNLLKNSNLEGTLKWYNTQWLGDATYSIGCGNAQKLYGQESFSINTTAYTGEGAGSIYQDVTTLSGNTTYTLSGYVKVESITDSDAINYGAVVGAAVYETDGSVTNYFSDYISEVTDTTINDGWRRVSVTFTTPETISQVRVHLAMKSTIGKAYFDAIQLEKAENASSYNLIQNGSMERYSGYTPDDWGSFANITFSDNADCISSENPQNGSASFKISGDVTKTKILQQIIPVSGTENDTYIISAWARSETAVPIKDDIKFKITIQVWYSDNTYVIKKTPSFNTSITTWQFQSTAFNLSDGTDSNKTPVSIRVFPNYSYQGNCAYFDNIQLVKEPSQSYTYDEEGNVVSVVDSAEQYSTLDYNSENLIESYTDPKGYTYTYKYNDKKQLSESHTQRGATYTYEYDDGDADNDGDLDVDGDDGRGYLKSVTGKTTPGHLTMTSTDIEYPTNNTSVYQIINTDELHRTTTSTYDIEKGTLKSTTDGKGTVSYTYNANNDILTSVSQGGATVSYTYDSNYKNLKAISTGTSSYYFNYDEFGNRTETKVGNKTLATYEYGANNGPLQRMDYGNGDYVTYTYDKYGNEKEKSVNGIKVYEGISDNTGAITKAFDNINQLQYNYVYDSLGRLLSSTRTNTLDNTRVAMFEYDFDLNNNLTKLAVLTPRGTNTMEYVYGGDNLPDTAKFNNGKILTYTYDSLGRTKNTSIDTTTPIATNYYYETYEDEENDKTYRSNLICMETSKYFESSYEFDCRNNITVARCETYDDDGNAVYTSIEKYTYDSLDQLKRVDYLTQNKRVEYTYDLGGNITKEKIYTLADDGTATLSETNSYVYGDSSWGDKLTRYKGQTITYDSIGNPTKYRDGFEFTWSNGRQLDSLTKDEKTVNYTYDSDGMRLSKTVDGVEYTYLYKDGLLVQETRGDITLDYSYDANGRLCMGAYRSSANATTSYFYYALNSRGDVIGLYKPNGDLFAKYTYDVWGNVLSVTNASGGSVADNNVAKIQPFRYRSYYYDTESGLYYLQSRYYDPVAHRFINADGYVSTGTGILGHNMFAYCDNNPVNYSDPMGQCYYTAGGLWAHDAWEFRGGYERKSDPKYFAGSTNSGKDVYISTTDNYSVSPNGIKVKDLRDTNMDNGEHNPDMKILDSFRITDKSIQEEVLKIIIKYTEDYPSTYEWDRNLESLVIEWDAHNKLYDVSKHTRLKDVDLDNAQEGYGYLDFVWLAFKEGIHDVI